MSVKFFKSKSKFLSFLLLRIGSSFCLYRVFKEPLKNSSNKIIHFNLSKSNITVVTLFLLALVTSCDNNDDNSQKSKDANSGVPYFQEGKGFKYLQTYITPSQGAFDYIRSLDLSLTDDGKLHWCLDLYNPGSDSRKLYRKTLSASTGDTLAVEGNLKKISPYWKKNVYDQGDFIKYVPYTNKLYVSFRSGTVKYQLSGDVPDFLKEGYDGAYSRAMIYTNGDVIMQNSGNVSANFGYMTTIISGSIWHNNAKLNIAEINYSFMSSKNFLGYDRLYHGGIVYPSDDNGNTAAFGFTDSKAYIFKKIGTETKAVDSIPFKGEAFKGGSVPHVLHNIYGFKSSKDLSTTVIVFCEPDRAVNSGKYFYSTVIINNSTNKLKLIVNREEVPGVLETGTYDTDLEGNLYYGVNGQSGGATSKIIKVTSAGRSTMADGFIGQQQIKSLQILGGKVYTTAIYAEGNTKSISLFVSN